jgi:hypothetical protein
VGESADQIREHIAVLSEFEAEYAEFVALAEAHHTGNEWKRGGIGLVATGRRSSSVASGTFRP